MSNLTSSGLVVKRLPDIISEFVANEKILVDPSVSTGDGTIFNFMNNIVGQSQAEIWSLVEAIYDDMNIDKAEGVALDNLAQLYGITRKLPTFSETDFQQYRMTRGLEVTTDMVIENPSTGDTFSPVVGGTADDTAADFYFDFDDDVDGSTLRAWVNGNQAAAAYQGTLNSTVSALAIEMNDLPQNNGKWSCFSFTNPLTGKVTVQLELDSLGVSSGDELTLLVQADGYPDWQHVNTRMNRYFTTRALAIGEVVATSNTVNNILVKGTTVGTDDTFTTYNTQDYITGTDYEDDEALRQRIKSTFSFSRCGTVDGITANLLEVSGVTSAYVVNNKTLVTDPSGRPAKSVNPIVQGGSDDSVAQALWDSVSAGIEIYAVTGVPENPVRSGVATDSLGNTHVVEFNYPSLDYYAINVRVNDTGDSTFNDAIKVVVLDYFSGLTISDIVEPSKILTKLQAEVSIPVGKYIYQVEQQDIPSSGDTPNPSNWDYQNSVLNNTGIVSINTADVYINTPS